MAISEKDIKKLWGLAGGRCAYPGCNCNCLPFLDESDPTVIGEMAHVISRQPTGPRGDGVGGSDTYDNLILLCPTHHTVVDKAPEGKFPEDMLHEWKATHEEAVNRALASPVFADRNELFRYISDLLSENKACWKNYGPDSGVAKSNPVANLFRIWSFRKLSIIVPNNARITDSLQRNKLLMEASENQVGAEFIEHAAGFEKNCYERYDGIPQFPHQFEEMING